MAGVFVPSQVDYVAYLAIYNTLNAYQAAQFQDHLIRYVCWAIENSVSLSSEEFAEWCAAAKAEINGTNGGQLNNAPASDTLG
jgi:hypothetical protein